MKKLLLLLLAITLSACSTGSRSELSRNRDKWETSNVKHYRYALFIGCFCGFTEKMPINIEVRDGKVASMTYQDGTPVAPTDIGAEFFQRFSTIDQMFTDLESGQSSQADDVQVAYDSKYGYPARINVDQIKEAIDDEYDVEVSGFEVLE
jgi:hypothetical protein